MAAAPVAAAVLPGEAELRNFAHTAAHLLIERMPRAPGPRTVARRAGVGLQPFDHRDYAPGDEVRHIDWRQTARSRRPVLRRFESESSSDWTLVIDASSSMAVHGAAKWHAAVHLAAAMGYALLQLGHRVGLLAFGAQVLAECPPGRGQHHYAALARQLAALQPRPAGEASQLGTCARHLHGVDTVFVISDFLADGEMGRDLTALARRSMALHALQVSDAAETRIGLTGEFDLVDVETGQRLHARTDARTDTLAARERAAMTARLRSFCARSGMAYTDWDIAMPWQHALLGHLVRARSLC